MMGRQASTSHPTRTHRPGRYRGAWGKKTGAQARNCRGNARNPTATGPRPAEHARAHPRARPGDPGPAPRRTAQSPDSLLPLPDPPGWVCAVSEAPPAGRWRSCIQAPPSGTPSADPSWLRPGLRPGSWLLPWRTWSPGLLGSTPRPPPASAGPAEVSVAAKQGCARPDAPPRLGAAPPAGPAEPALPSACAAAAAAATAAGARGLRWALLWFGADGRRGGRARPEAEAEPGRPRRARRPSRDEALRPSMAGPGPTFPLHRLVWANRHRELEAALNSRQVRPVGRPGRPPGPPPKSVVCIGRLPARLPLPGPEERSPAPRSWASGLGSQHWALPCRSPRFTLHPASELAPHHP